MTQAELAQASGISLSYLNLIENDKRPIGGALLNRIAEKLGVNAGQLSGAAEGALVQDILELAHSLGEARLDQDSAIRFVARDPDWASAIQNLYRRYQDATETAVALSGRLSQDPQLMAMTHSLLNRITAIKSMASILHEEDGVEEADRQRFSRIISSESDVLGGNAREIIALLEGGAEAKRSGSPKNEVDDFIIYSGNHFPELEEAAEALRARLPAGALDGERGLTDALQERGVSIRNDGPAGTPRGEPPGRDVLILDRQARATTRRFQMARRLLEIDHADLIDALCVRGNPSSEEARAMIARAVANYAAGALLGPYEPFLETARTVRYDIDRLGFEFGMSFEQTAHRLVTLRRDGSEGVPFAFLRADPAGNLSKPFSTQGLRMPRLGTACPLWALYSAFSNPGRTIPQMAVMPQGERFLFVARRIAKRVTDYGAPQTVYSVMIGCDAIYADQVVYGDSFRSDRPSLETPVGSTCSACSRTGCSQRATPFILTAGQT